MGEILLSSRKISGKTNEFLKMGELCRLIMKNRNNFQNIKCSEELGVVTFTYSGKKVIITKIGRITVQRAENKENLLKIIELLMNLLIQNDIISGNVDNE